MQKILPKVHLLS